MKPRSVCLLALSVVLGCSPANQPPPDPTPGKVVFTGDQKADWDQITALENQAKALVKADGCASAAQCRTAPVGSRGCGGPRYYLVYCAKTTDSAALYKKLEAIATAEHEYNVRYQIGSTCEFRMPPRVALVGSSCQAQ
ncbi:MAG TPA: hypothetical protein VJ865_10575 [Gemmatimonadaceae bacterium]|nr:hypothetical protein [Gemmatimonadaceae bacterium]